MRQRTGCFLVQSRVVSVLLRYPAFFVADPTLSSVDPSLCYKYYKYIQILASSVVRSVTTRVAAARRTCARRASWGCCPIAQSLSTGMLQSGSLDRNERRTSRDKLHRIDINGSRPIGSRRSYDPSLEIFLRLCQNSIALLSQSL